MRFAYWPNQPAPVHAAIIAITIVLFLLGLAVLH